MIGNYKVDGNIIVIPDASNTCTINSSQSFLERFFCKSKSKFSKKKESFIADSEFNAYVDPDGFSNVIKSTSMHIVPLDCTNYVPLSKKTFDDIKEEGDKLKSNTNDKFILNNYHHFIEILRIDANTPGLSLWDVVATLIFLDLPMDQRCEDEEIDVSWTGKIIPGEFKNKIYNFIDYNKCIKAINTVLFSKI